MMETEKTVRRPLAFLRSNFAIPFFLAVLVLLIYSPALFAQFNWDDLEIIGHDYMRNWAGLKTIWLSPSQSICGDYWPVNYTTHWVEYHLWKMRPAGYHAVNILLHWVNACVLLYLLQRMALRGTLLVTILFAIFPMQVSSVAWAVERKDLVNALFYLLAFLGWLRFEEKPSAKRYGVVFLLFTASLLSKSMSITWPVAVLIYCWWRMGRIDWRRVVLPLVPLLVWGFGLALISMRNHQKNDRVVPDAFLFSLPEKLILVGKNIAFYAYKIIWPVEHFPVYPHWKIDAHLWMHYLPLFLAGGLVLTLWLLRNRVGRGPFAALAFYLITLSPILGLVGWGMTQITYVQDHYQYLACIGPFLLFAYAVDQLSLRMRRPQAGYVAVALLLFPPLIVIGHTHTRLYCNSETLFTANYKRYPTAPVAVLLGMGLAKNGKVEEGLALLEKALAEDPSRLLAWQHKGDLLLRLGRYPEAAAAYKQGLSLNKPGRVDIKMLNSYTTALIYCPSPNFAPVLPLLEIALENNAQDLTTEGNLAIVLSLIGRQTEAQAHFEHVIKSALHKTPPDVFYYYGRLRLNQGEADDALTFLRWAQRTALQPRPEYATAIQQAESALKKTEK